MKRPIRVRFAPSPTGELHVGNARTALFNWLFARQSGGKLILRIEDTDRQRAEKVFEEHLLDDLHWLGIDWDEGPDKGGPHGPYRQMERLEIYRDHLDKLIAAGRAYPCYCLEEELERERQDLIARRMMPRYMGKCRALSDGECKRLEMEGRRPSYRFAVQGGAIEFDDIIRGPMRFEGRAIGDFIIVRSNGLPAYNFAVVVDDHFMEISHVIRGEDHLSNTAVQALLYRALGFAPPLYSHHSLVLGKDRAKLSKRHGAVSIKEFRQRGFLPEALVNYLSLIGNSFGQGKEICSISEIMDIFSLEKTGKGGAVFDEDKLKWLNGIYIKKYSTDQLTELLMPFIGDAGYRDKCRHAVPALTALVDAVRENLSTLAEIKDYLDMFQDEKYDLSDDAKAILRKEESQQILKLFYEIYSSCRNAERSEYERSIKEVQSITGARGRALFLPLRCAVTGSIRGPELEKIIPVLGKQSVLKRLEKALKVSSY